MRISEAEVGVAIQLVERILIAIHGVAIDQGRHQRRGMRNAAAQATGRSLPEAG